MTIATQQDVIDHLGNNGEALLTQMTDPANAFINSLLVATGLQRTDDEIYTYLSPRLTVPLTAPYPPILIKIACVIFIYWIWSGDERPDRIKDDYKWATGVLRDFSAGKIGLGLMGDGSGAVEVTGNGVEFVGADPVFSRSAGDWF